MPDDVFERVGEAVLTLVPAELGRVQLRARRWGLKAWFVGRDPGGEHYEAQVVAARHVEDADHLAIEIGFHAEHRDATTNAALIDALVGYERRWRKVVGPNAQVDWFVGGHDSWRRISETWADPNLADDDLVTDIALCLVDYIAGLEPVRRSIT